MKKMVVRGFEICEIRFQPQDEIEINLASPGHYRITKVGSTDTCLVSQNMKDWIFLHCRR